MRKLLILILIVLIAIAIPVTAFAEPEEPVEPTPTPIPTPAPTPTPAATNTGFAGAPEVDLSRITAEAVVLADAVTGEILFSKNADWTIFPASTTKLMTAILTAENCELDEMVMLDDTIMTAVNALGDKGSLMKLRLLEKGTEISVKDLFYGLMMCSGNDAAVALGIHIAGSEEAFARMMNAKALELGMEHTNFLNAYGIYIANIGHDHYSTAADMTKLAVAAYAYPEVTEVVGTSVYTYETVSGLTETGTVQNSNFLIHIPTTLTPEKQEEYAKYLYDYANGMKTGTLNNIIVPGATEVIPMYGCLVASAQNNGMDLVAVIYGDKSKDALDRWNIARYLFDYGFENFEKVNLAQYMQPFAGTEAVQGAGDVATMEVASKTGDSMEYIRLVTKQMAQGLADGSVAIEQRVTADHPLKAPIDAEKQVGQVTYLLDGEELASVPLVAVNQVVADVKKEALPKPEADKEIEFQPWWLFIIIPAGLVATLFIMRAVNLARRRARNARRRQQRYHNTARRIK